MDLHQASALELARYIKERKVSSEEVVRAHVERLRSWDRRINAVVTPLYDEALESAREADRRAAQEAPSRLPPLHGVPFTIKSSYSLRGKPWAVGCHHRRDLVAERTADAVEAFARAGAIPLCLTNVPEALAWLETDNRVHGRTSNPYAPSRTPGGSSGGEAAVIAVGGAPFGIGSDFGGSVRIPASFCGISGHKPSSGLTSHGGTWPDCPGEIALYNCAGPMARRASDLPALLDILLGGTGEKGLAQAAAAARPGKTRVYYYTQLGSVRLAPELRAAVEESVRGLEALGYEVREWSPPGIAEGARIWQAMVASVQGVRPFAEVIGGGSALGLAAQLALLPFGRSRHTLPALGLAVLDRFARLNPSGLRKLVEAGHALRREIETQLGRDGVLVSPAYSRPAPPHGWMRLRPFDWVYSGIYNVLELPSTAVPVGMSREGLPLGLQVAASHGNDALSLAVAGLLERRIPPPVPKPE